MDATKAAITSPRNTADAIKKARNLILNSARPRITKFVILATDGFPQDYNKALNEVTTSINVF